MKKKGAIFSGLALFAAATGIGVALFKRKQREVIFREAEMQATSELEEFLEKETQTMED